MAAAGGSKKVIYAAIVGNLAIGRKGVRNRLWTIWLAHDMLITLWDDQNVLRMVV